MNFNIRKYEDTDLNDILSCWENATRLAHPFLTDNFLESERQMIPDFYLPQSDTWVAEYNGEVIGFMSLITDNEVGALFVQPDYHGKGIGWALMDKARKLRDYLEVQVFEANTIGRRFYSKYGFEPLSQYIHEETGNIMLRLKFSAKND
jgi:putative acetyltransferase